MSRSASGFRHGVRNELKMDPRKMKVARQQANSVLQRIAEVQIARTGAQKASSA
jgi:hypothetical protein